MSRKNKAPAAFRFGDHAYIRDDQIIKLIKDVGKHAIKDYHTQAKMALQEHLDAGDIVDIRKYKDLMGENSRNLNTLLNAVVYAFEDITEEE